MMNQRNTESNPSDLLNQQHSFRDKKKRNHSPSGFLIPYSLSMVKPSGNLQITQQQPPEGAERR